MSLKKPWFAETEACPSQKHSTTASRRRLGCRNWWFLHDACSKVVKTFCWCTMFEHLWHHSNCFSERVGPGVHWCSLHVYMLETMGNAYFGQDLAETNVRILRHHRTFEYFCGLSCRKPGGGCHFEQAVCKTLSCPQFLHNVALTVHGRHTSLLTLQVDGSAVGILGRHAQRRGDLPFRCIHARSIWWVPARAKSAETPPSCLHGPHTPTPRPCGSRAQRAAGSASRDPWQQRFTRTAKSKIARAQQALLGR